jgi:hypothetical protein
MTNKLKAQLATLAGIASFVVAALVAGNAVMAIVIVGLFLVVLGAIWGDAISEDTP